MEDRIIKLEGKVKKLEEKVDAPIRNLQSLINKKEALEKLERTKTMFNP
jgi:hypothetical protein